MRPEYNPCVAFCNLCVAFARRNRPGSLERTSPRKCLAGTLVVVSHQRTSTIALVAWLAVCLTGLPAVSAVAAPSAAHTSADRTRLDVALSRLDAARKRSDDIASRADQSSASLDRVLVEQARLQDGIETRAVALYRAGETAYISMLLSADTLEEFTSLWELLARVSE
jgi:hypothetical protein